MKISPVLVFHKLNSPKRLGFTMFHGISPKRLRLAVNELWIAVDKLLI